MISAQCEVFSCRAEAAGHSRRCASHCGKRNKQKPSLSRVLCRFVGCPRPAQTIASTFCKMHRNTRPCSSTGCESLVFGKRVFCKQHRRTCEVCQLAISKASPSLKFCAKHCSQCSFCTHLVSDDAVACKKHQKATIPT